MATTIKPSPAIPAAAPAALTLDKLPALGERIRQSIVNLRWNLQAPEAQLLERARAVKTITSVEVAESVGRDLVMVKRLKRAGETHYELLKAPFNKVRQMILGWESEDVGAWETEEKRLSRLITAWRNEQLQREEAKRQEQQRLLDEQARRERETQVAQVKRVAEQAPTPEVKAALEIEAESLAAAPVPVPVATIESEIPITPGLSFTKSYRAEIVGDPDLMKFVKAIAAKKLPIRAAIGLTNALDDDGHDRFGVYTSPWLNDQARSNAGELPYPGVTVRAVDGTTGR
jgi:hypothetical protein